MKKSLKDYTTEELVAELSGRQEVETAGEGVTHSSLWMETISPESLLQRTKHYRGKHSVLVVKTEEEV